MKWLFKEEPTHYHYDELVADGRTVWDGVRNPLAQKHLRAVRKGDDVFFYHTGKEKAVIGVAVALTDAYPDPEDETGRRVVVDVAPREKLARPVTLKEIKASPAFEGFVLTRAPRLSVMPVSDAEWGEIERLSRTDP